MTDNFSFEKAYERLETILETLNEGDVSLDSSLTLYEEATKLIGTCSKKLTEAEKKIEILLKNTDGTLKTENGEPVAETFEREGEQLIHREVP